MKTNLPSHIDDWSFGKNSIYTFIEKYDLMIIVSISTITYFLIF